MIRQKQVLDQSTSMRRTAYILSDYQKNISSLESQQDSTTEVVLVPFESVEQRNLTVDSAWFQAPIQMLNETNRMIVKVRNLSDQPAEDVRVTLRLDGKTNPQGNLDIPAKGFALDTLNLTVLSNGWHEGELTITDYPINFDDSYYFAFEVAERVKILSLEPGAPNAYLNATFERRPTFEVDNRNVGQIDYSTLPDYNLIIVNDVRAISSGLASELQQFADKGGSVVVFPGSNVDKASYNSFLRMFNANEITEFEQKERGVSYINTDDFVFKDVFLNQNANLKLPTTQSNYKMTRQGSKKERVILRYRDGNTFVGKYRHGAGQLYFCTAPLHPDQSDLARNGDIFAPMIFKMALAANRTNHIGYTISKDQLLETENRKTNLETVYKVGGPSDEFIPEQRVVGSRVRVMLNNQIQEAGFYNLYLDEEEVLEKYAFNYDRKESVLEYLSSEELTALGTKGFTLLKDQSDKNFTDLIGSRSNGTQLWKYCIILALIFLAIEILLLRFWKT